MAVKEMTADLSLDIFSLSQDGTVSSGVCASVCLWTSPRPFEPGSHLCQKLGRPHRGEHAACKEACFLCHILLPSSWTLREIAELGVTHSHQFLFQSGQVRAFLEGLHLLGRCE